MPNMHAATPPGAKVRAKPSKGPPAKAKAKAPPSKSRAKRSAASEGLQIQIEEEGLMTMREHLTGALLGSVAEQDPPKLGERPFLAPTGQHLHLPGSPISVPIKPEDGSLPLYDYEKIPAWMQDNPFIVGSYRAHYSVSMCFRSLFALHNETANVWTHLIGLIFFIGFMGYAFGTVIKPHLSHIFVFVAFSLGCCLCMGCSATFHLFSAHHCERVYSRMMMMDYFGITSLIIASFYPICYYAFSCHPELRWGYIGTVTMLGLAGLVGPFFDFFHRDSFYWPRLLFFCSLTLAGAFPMVHVNYLMPAGKATPLIRGLALMLFLYGSGVVVYVLKIPERLIPGRFDLWFHSHQLWHVFVLAASVVHFFTCLGAYLRWETMEDHC